VGVNSLNERGRRCRERLGRGNGPVSGFIELTWLQRTYTSAL